MLSRCTRECLPEWLGYFGPRPQAGPPSAMSALFLARTHPEVLPQIAVSSWQHERSKPSDKHQTKVNTRPDLLAHRKQLKTEEDEIEAFKSVAVSPKWVLEQEGVHYKGPDESRNTRKVIKEL